MKMIHIITLIMATIGGLHFFLIGFDTDLIHSIFGDTEHMKLINVIIGMSILWQISPMIKAQLNQ